MGFLFYTGDQVGLGHTSRLLAVAAGLRQARPTVPLTFLSQAADTRLLAAERVPFVQLLPHLPHLERQAVHQLWQASLPPIFETVRPDVLVMDSALHPDLMALAIERGLRIVLILRERTDLGRFLQAQREWLPHLALVVFPHQRDDLPSGLERRLPGTPLYFSGPLLRRTPTDLDLAAAERAWPADAQTFRVVLSNGGGNGSPALDDDFLEVALEAFSLADAHLPPFTLQLISGPLARRPLRPRRFVNGQLLLREFEPRLFDLLATAHLAVTRGGYNTAHELACLGLPAVCVPAYRTFESQARRIDTIGPNLRRLPLDAAALAAALQAAAAAPRWAFTPPPQDPWHQARLALARRLLALLPSPAPFQTNSNDSSYILI